MKWQRRREKGEKKESTAPEMVKRVPASVGIEPTTFNSAAHVTIPLSYTYRLKCTYYPSQISIFMM